MAAPFKSKAMAFLVLIFTTILLIGGVCGRKLISIEESIREDPDLSEVLNNYVKVRLITGTFD